MFSVAEVIACAIGLPQTQAEHPGSSTPPFDTQHGERDLNRNEGFTMNQQLTAGVILGLLIACALVSLDEYVGKIKKPTTADCPKTTEMKKGG